MDRYTKRLKGRVEGAAEGALRRQSHVSPIDVLVGIGWLPQSTLDQWRQGRLPSLERGIEVGPGRLGAAMRLLRDWAVRRVRRLDEPDRSPARAPRRCDHEHRHVDRVRVSLDVRPLLETLAEGQDAGPLDQLGGGEQRRAMTRAAPQHRRRRAPCDRGRDLAAGLSQRPRGGLDDPGELRDIAPLAQAADGVDVGAGPLDVDRAAPAVAFQACADERAVRRREWRTAFP